MTQAISPGTNASQTLSYNFKLLSHHTLDGFGGVDEGMGMQKTKDGRRIMWLGHEAAPKNFTGADVTDPKHPKVVTRYNYSPPMNGFTHTAMPLFSRDLLIVTDECVQDDGKDWPKLTWVVNMADETNLVPISTLPLPPAAVFTKRGGRFGSHNLYENYPLDVAWRSDNIILATFFNGGLRVYDLANPYQPQEVAYFVPGAPALSPKGSVQINDVYVDDRNLVYTVDRFSGGLYILEMNL